MKNRERVLAALNHEEPDRCPMQISFTPEFAERLEDDMHIKGMKAHKAIHTAEVSLSDPHITFS